MKNKKGISLIVLVITIIIIVILSVAIMLSLAKNNPILESQHATFLNDLSAFNSELDLYKSNQILNNKGNYDDTLLFADVSSLIYNKQTIEGNINTVIPSIGSTKYLGNLEIVEGKLCYIGTDPNEIQWAEANNLNTFSGGSSLDITTAQQTYVNPGTNVVYDMKVASIKKITNISLNGNLEVTDNFGITISPQPAISVGTPTGTSNDTERDVSLTINTSSMSGGTFKIKVKSGAIQYSSGEFNTSDTLSSNSFTVEVLKVNPPLLVTGMIPIKWDDSGNLVTTTSADPNWYDYDSKKWANAQTADGSMWVWIPRYEYKIGQIHTYTVQTISINFIIGNSTTVTSGYKLEPAFSFGNTELTGIWVAKFEASSNNNKVKIVPNATPWYSSMTVSSMFDKCRSMELDAVYGWVTSGIGIDTHMMKNVEWGAVAYLSQSIYGKNGEVWTNPNNSPKTGQAGTSAGAASTATTYPYNNLTYGINASTSGTVYGVYDMAGGKYEYTAAYINNGNANLTTYSNSLYTADPKYKDVYTVTTDTGSNNFNNASSKYGDAIYETSVSATGSNDSWYRGWSYMPVTSSPIFVRGAAFSDGAQSDIFAFFARNGSVLDITFRPVLAINPAL